MERCIFTNVIVVIVVGFIVVVVGGGGCGIFFLYKNYFLYFLREINLSTIKKKIKCRIWPLSGIKNGMRCRNTNGVSPTFKCQHLCYPIL